MTDLDALITKSVRRENELERLAHTPSGKLSASMLNQPLLEQVLKLIGVPQDPIDDYALRLFARGKQAEEFIIHHLPKGETQKEVEYRNTVGLVDYISEDGIPIEVKSTKNSAFKWVEKEGKPKIGHRLQAGLYALSLDKPTYRVLYVAADDLRTLTFEGETERIQPAIDKIITEVEDQLKSHTLPAFLPREDWQANQKYSNYSAWIVLTPDEAMAKLEKDYPDSYHKLKEFEKE